MTKREMLKYFIEHGNCADMACADCPYQKNLPYCPNISNGGLKRIGAMAILRMFKEKKKPLLENGTKIKFSDGRIATLVKTEPIDSFYRLDFGDYSEDTDYLIGRTWEVVE